MKRLNNAETFSVFLCVLCFVVYSFIYLFIYLFIHVDFLPALNVHPIPLTYQIALPYRQTNFGSSFHLTALFIEPLFYLDTHLK